MAKKRENNDYTMAIHAAISKTISTHGLPDFVSYDDMYSYVVSEFEEIRTIYAGNGGGDYKEFFTDFLLEVEQMLDEKFYGAKLNATLHLGSQNKHESTLALTREQLSIFERYVSLVPATLKRMVSTNNLDPIVGWDDLEQVGRIALSRAVRSYNEDRNFRSYAIMKIRHAILNTISSTDMWKHGSCVSIDAMLDEDDDTASVSPLSEFIGESVADAYERTELYDMLYAEAMKYPETHVVRRGILVCIERFLHNKTWTDLSIEYGVSPGLVSAWFSKARPVLFKNGKLRDLLNLPAYKAEAN